MQPLLSNLSLRFPHWLNHAGSITHLGLYAAPDDLRLFLHVDLKGESNCQILKNILYVSVSA